MAAKTQDAAGEAGEKYLRAALTPIVNDAMKRAQVRAQMPGLPDSRPFVDAIVQLVEQTPLANPRVQYDSLRAAAQGMWDAFKDFERYPRTVDGDRLNALAALRAALDKPTAAPTGETGEAPDFDVPLADDEYWAVEGHATRWPIVSEKEARLAVKRGYPVHRVRLLPAPSAPQEPRGESGEGMRAEAHLRVMYENLLHMCAISDAFRRSQLREFDALLAALSSEARDAD